MTIRSLRMPLTAAALCLTLTGGARAETIVIDDTAAGTVIDGILDGFPFPPPGLAPDGIGDFAGNALAVALQTGATEERGIVELPLAPLVGLTSADIASATLTFNIDDVISTFGPGTTFDGTASSSLTLFRYSGNGTVDLADFGNVAGAPLAVVSTASFGTITDVTLAGSGPLQFEVDVTTALGGLLDSSATFMGIVFTTTDAGSATSLDNLGLSGAGPAGVNGARMPYLTITTVPTDPPNYDKTKRGCQAAIAKGGSKLTTTLHKSLAKCFDGVLKAASDNGDYSKITPKCSAALALATPGSKVAKAVAQLEAAISSKCGTLVPIDLNYPCSPSAITFADVAACLTSQHITQISAAVKAEYSRACALMTAVGLETDYPALCSH